MEELLFILNEFKSQIFSVVNIKVITLIVVIILNSCVLLYLFWFFIRLIIKFLKSALKGKLYIGSSDFQKDYARYSKSSFSGDKEDRSLYKKLLSYEHSRGIYHKDDNDFI